MDTGLRNLRQIIELFFKQAIDNNWAATSPPAHYQNCPQTITTPILDKIKFGVKVPTPILDNN